MSSESPAAELYSSDGYELSAQNAVSTPVGTRGILSMGSDGTNSRFIKVDSSGNVIAVGAGVAGTPAGGVVSIQGVTSGTAVTVAGTVTGNQGTANTLANAWSMKITDATNGPAAVKPASTAAVATDPALVVAISPNNSLAFTTNDSTASGALGALNATVQLAVAGERTVGMLLAAGTLVGTIVPEISMDGGTTWVQTFFDDPSTSNIMANVVFGSSNTVTTKTIVGAGGSSHARVRVSAYTSGTATCNVRGVQLDDPSVMFGGAADSALPPVVIQDGGSVTTAAPAYSNATLNALSLNTTGDLRTISKLTDGTNTAAIKDASTAAAATDPALVVSVSPNSPIPTRASTTLPTTVSNGSAVPAMADIAGRLVVRLSGPRERLVVNNVTQSTTTASTLVAAGAAGVFRDLTFLGLSNTSATAVRIDISDGTRTYSWMLAQNGGGMVINFAPPLKATTAATAWTINLSAAVTDVRASVQAVETN